MRFPPGVRLPTHYHTGIVIAHTIKGAWRYLEHDWVARAGGTVYETAGAAHTPESCGDEEAEVFFVIVGELLFLDEHGNGDRPREPPHLARALPRVLPRARDHAARPERAPMTGRSPAPSLVQVAFSVVDLAATERWFRDGLGFWPAGGSRRMMRGPLASSVQGLPRVASTCWWMVDRNEFFQLEMFQFERPLGAADATRREAVRHRVRADRRLGRRLRRDADATGAPWLTPAQRPDRARRRAPRVRAQPRRRLRRDHGERPARGRRTRRRTLGLSGRTALGHAVGAGPRPLRGRSSATGSASSAPLSPCERPSTKRCGAWRAPALGAACSDAGASSSSWCSTSIRSGGRARRATGSRIRASSTSPSAPDSRRDHRELYDRATAAGARPNRRPLHTARGAASSTSTTRRLLGRASVDVPEHRAETGDSRHDRLPSGHARTRTRSSEQCGSPRPRRPRGT